MAANSKTVFSKDISLTEYFWISNMISLKYVPQGPIDNMTALDQIMVWHRTGDKHHLNQWWLDYWRIYAALGLND